MTTTYLPDDEFHAIAGALVTLAKTLHARSELDVSDVRAALGTYLDVWPRSVADDLDAMNHRDRLTGRLPTPYEVRNALTPVPDDIVSSTL